MQIKIVLKNKVKKLVKRYKQKILTSILVKTKNTPFITEFINLLAIVYF